METITYSHVQKLVSQLPAAKLPLVYNLLVDIAKHDIEALSSQQRFMLLPLEERRSILAEQAERMTAHYQQSWQPLPL